MVFARVVSHVIYDRPINAWKSFKTLRMNGLQTLRKVQGPPCPYD